MKELSEIIFERAENLLRHNASHLHILFFPRWFLKASSTEQIKFNRCLYRHYSIIPGRAMLYKWVHSSLKALWDVKQQHVKWNCSFSHNVKFHLICLLQISYNGQVRNMSFGSELRSLNCFITEITMQKLGNHPCWIHENTGNSAEKRIIAQFGNIAFESCLLNMTTTVSAESCLLERSKTDHN